MPYLMPYGDYKGQPIETVPTGDIERARKWSKIRPDTAAEFDKELAKRRGGDGPATGHGKPAGPTVAGTGSPSAINARARDIIAVGADRLQACAYTNEALAWLLQLVDGSAAPDGEVPF